MRVFRLDRFLESGDGFRILFLIVGGYALFVELARFGGS
jgi:hypothetical protein